MAVGQAFGAADVELTPAHVSELESQVVPGYRARRLERRARVRIGWLRRKVTKPARR